MATDSPIDNQNELTVDELKEDIDGGDYAVEELRAVRSHELEQDDPRSTLVEYLDDTIDEQTSGPTVTAEQTAADEADVQQDVPGVYPSPYADDAPESVFVNVPTDMTFAGDFFDYAGVYEVTYNARVKRSLESDTNLVTLSERDPLHPNYDPESESDEDEPAGEVIA